MVVTERSLISLRDLSRALRDLSGLLYRGSLYYIMYLPMEMYVEVIVTMMQVPEEVGRKLRSRAKISI